MTPEAVILAMIVCVIIAFLIDEVVGLLVLLFLLFGGEPDLQDALVTYFESCGKLK